MAISKVNSPYTKIQDVPDVPTIGTATEGAESAEVAFTPAVTGGKAYQYRALSNPGGIEAISPSSPILIEGLTADISYNFQVRAESNTGATNGYSSASNSIVPTSSGAYNLLETTVLTSSASSVSFTGLGSYTDYKHLQIRATNKIDGTFNAAEIFFNNNLSQTPYRSHNLQGNGSSVVSQVRDYIFLPDFVSTNATADSFAASVIDILDFSDTAKNTTLRALYGRSDANTQIFLASGFYDSTAAITEILIRPQSPMNFVTGSRFSLYGIKAA